MTGLGAATLIGRELAVVTCLKEHVVLIIMSSDATKIEDTWQFLYCSAYWRRGPVAMAAIAAVNMRYRASKEKPRECPLISLGGSARKGLLAHGGVWGKEILELFGPVRDHLDQG